MTVFLLFADVMKDLVRLPAVLRVDTGNVAELSK